MIIDASGDVGIGTTTPGNNLHVTSCRYGAGGQDGDWRDRSNSPVCKSRPIYDLPNNGDFR